MKNPNDIMRNKDKCEKEKADIKSNKENTEQEAPGHLSAATENNTTISKTKIQISPVKTFLQNNLLGIENVEEYILWLTKVIKHTGVDEKYILYIDKHMHHVAHIETLMKDVKFKPILFAILLRNVGNYLLHIKGSYYEAKSFIVQALNLIKEHHENNYIELAITLSSLGKVNMALGYHKEAKLLFEEVFEIERKYFGCKNPSIASTYYNLGCVYRHLRKYSEATLFLLNALTINMRLYEKKTPIIASIYTELAIIQLSLDNKKNKSMAKQLLIDALEILESCRCSDTETASTIIALGMAFGKIGDHYLKKVQLEKALKIFESRFGKNHNQIANILYNLGNAYMHLKQYKKAEEVLKRALEIKEYYLEKDHPDLITILYDLNIVYDNIHDNRQKREIRNRILEIKRLHYKKDQPFENFDIVELNSSKPNGEGKQEKGTWTGKYINKKDGKMYFIKKSKKYPADNLAEVVTSKFLAALIDEHAVPYEFINCSAPESPNKAELANDYIVSTIYDGFCTVKKVFEERFPASFPAWLKKTPNPLTKKNKEKIYSLFNAKQRSQLAGILAASALLLERDTHIENIFFYNDPNNKAYDTNPDKEQEYKEVGKFDNGWGLAGICLANQNRVDIFSSRLYMFSKEGEGTHSPRPFPTNHFNDYEQIIHSQYFIDALDKIIKKARANLKQDTIRTIVGGIEKHFPEEEHKAKFIQLADHIGLLAVLKHKEQYPNDKDFKNMSSEEMKAFILNKLRIRLTKRTNSLEILKILLNLDINYHKAPNEQYKQTQKQLDYNPELDLKLLRDHFLKIYNRLDNNFLKISQGKNKTKEKVTFNHIVEALPTFNENIENLIRKVIDKYRILPDHDKELTQFYEELLINKQFDKLPETINLKRKRSEVSTALPLFTEQSSDKRPKHHTNDKMDTKHVHDQLYQIGKMTIESEKDIASNNDLTLGDGNCAINAVVLGLCHLIAKGKLDNPEFYSDIYKADIYKALNLSSGKQIYLSEWLEKNTNNIQRQKILASILRRLSVEHVEKNYKAYKDGFEAQLVAAFLEYKQNRRDETFCVHKHIIKEFERLKQASKAIPIKNEKDIKELDELQIKDQLISWWNKTGKAEYFRIMQQPANSASDYERWGSEIEIGALAHRYKFKIMNGEQILGFGNGILQNLSKNEIQHMVALGIGSEFQGGLRIECDKDMLVKILKLERLTELELKTLNDDLGKAAILNFVNNIDRDIVIPNMDIKVLCEKLQKLDVFKQKGENIQFVVSDETLKYIGTSIPAELRKKLLDGYIENIPSFKVRHQGGHWSFEGLIRLDETSVKSPLNKDPKAILTQFQTSNKSNYSNYAPNNSSAAAKSDAWFERGEYLNNCVNLKLKD